MNTELISVVDVEIAGEMKQTVDLRDLHAFLESRRDFSNWVKSRIEEYDFVKGVDYIVCSPNLASTTCSGGRNRLDYIGTLDMAKELAMVERNAKGREARQYFIDCEKKVKEIHEANPKAPVTSGQMFMEVAKQFLVFEQRLLAMESSQQQMQDRMDEALPRDGYITIMGFCTKYHLRMTTEDKRLLGMEAAKLCKQRKVFVDEVPDKRYGKVNAYPEELLSELIEIEGEF